jgi:hypothetical protein
LPIATIIIIIIKSPITATTTTATMHHYLWSKLPIQIWVWIVKVSIVKVSIVGTVEIRVMVIRYDFTLRLRLGVLWLLLLLLLLLKRMMKKKRRNNSLIGRMRIMIMMEEWMIVFIPMLQEVVVILGTMKKTTLIIIINRCRRCRLVHCPLHHHHQPSHCHHPYSSLRSMFLKVVVLLPLLLLPMKREYLSSPIMMSKRIPLSETIMIFITSMMMMMMSTMITIQGGIIPSVPSMQMNSPLHPLIRRMKWTLRLIHLMKVPRPRVVIVEEGGVVCLPPHHPGWAAVMVKRLML